MVIAEPIDQIPLWMWDHIVALLDHDTHIPPGACCSALALATIPAHVRLAAEGIQAYRRLSAPTSLPVLCGADDRDGTTCYRPANHTGGHE